MSTCYPSQNKDRWEPGINGLLAYGGFTVAQLGPQNYLMVTFLVSEYIIGIEIFVVDISPTLVSWPVESELFVNEK